MGMFVMSITFLILHTSSIIPITASQASQPTACNSCCQGPAGIPGVPGTSIPGNNGNNGVPGRDGIKGDTGDRGDTGSAGERGPPGPQGPSGEIGQPGPPGLQGSPGKVGPRGREGIRGAAGQSGPIGEKGIKGEAPQIQQSAFTVIKTNSQNPASGILTFDTVETNIGNHYDASTHKFTCQIPGTYVFMFTISSNYYSSDPWIALKKDGAAIVAAHIRDSDTVNNFEQSSQSAVLQLTVGNQVWLHGSGTVFSNSDRYVTFSGFLLYG